MMVERLNGGGRLGGGGAVLIEMSKVDDGVKTQDGWGGGGGGWEGGTEKG